MSGRSMYEYAGNKRWLQEEGKEAAGQGVLNMDLPNREAVHDLDRRYTTRATLDWCMRAAGVTAFDLDVAACEESHKAPRWYGVETNGLIQPWSGRVWVNPPYSDIEPWVEKAWGEMARSGSNGHFCSIAMLLPATRTEQPWFQAHVEPFRDGRGKHPSGAELTTHNLPGRQTFGIPGNTEGIGVGSPPFGVVLLVFRRPTP